MGYVGSSACLTPIDVGERLPVGVLHIIAAGYLLQEATDASSGMQRAKGSASKASHRAVAKILCASEMTDAGHEVWLHPLSIMKSQFRNWTAFQLARL